MATVRFWYHAKRQYRLWAAHKHQRLAEMWSPHWASQQTCGTKQGQPPEVMAFDTCDEMHQAITDGYVAAGVSYDMRMCFDTVPLVLSFNIT